MDSWRRCLDAAGVHDRDVRADYAVAARYLRRHQEFAAWGAIRVLAPAEFVPHAVAGLAFISFTDDICDRGTPVERARGFGVWSGHVRTALATGGSRHPLLRAFVRSIRACGLSRGWADAYVTGMRIDLSFPGFADEAAYQRYVDTVSWPGVMLVTGLTPHLVPDEDFAVSCRLAADAIQRVDFLTDLADDLRGGYLALPQSDLDHHGVTRADLEQGLRTPAVGALVAVTAAKARATLEAAGRVVGEVPAAYRPLVTCLLELYHQRLDNVEIRGAAVARRGVRDNPWECLRLIRRARGTGLPAAARR
ncbi:squalene/phytoene synthase family protein [Streptomyces sp. TRM70308]|uniref:phytoene/squalene synthase family protein n=1 Tax=Streptomyces sp. TRM70308 TaxID=3131932 RepID=UPI003D08F107